MYEQPVCHRVDRAPVAMNALLRSSTAARPAGVLSLPRRDISALTVPHETFSIGFFHGGNDAASKESLRVISTARLSMSPCLHLPPIDVVVFNDPQGDLILWLASCLDAFSTYPYPTRLPGRAPGGTTGVPEVGPTRSSRTSVRSPQISNAHNR